MRKDHSRLFSARQNKMNRKGSQPSVFRSMGQNELEGVTAIICGREVFPIGFFLYCERMRNAYGNRSSSASSTGRRPPVKRRKRTRRPSGPAVQQKKKPGRKKGIRIGKRRVRTRVLVVLLLGVLGMGSCIGMNLLSLGNRTYVSYQISEQVYQYEPLVSAYARQYGVDDYIPVLLCIMQAESGGQGSDVMQSSESLGLPVNTLETEASIEQGVKFFSELVQEAEQRNLDLPSIIQAYNYGKGFLKYVQEHGGTYTFEAASEFGRLHSGQKRIEYNNPIAVEYNGGWRWAYGNMFYYPVVQKYLDQLS